MGARPALGDRVIPSARKGHLMPADKNTVKSGRIETPQQASKRYDAIQKKLKQEAMERQAQREADPEK